MSKSARGKMMTIYYMTYLGTQLHSYNYVITETQFNPKGLTIWEDEGW